MGSLWESGTFRTDMEMLKEYLSRADRMDLVEEDVLRLESATASFLKELRVPVVFSSQSSFVKKVLQ